MKPLIKKLSAYDCDKNQFYFEFYEIFTLSRANVKLLSLPGYSTVEHFQSNPICSRMRALM